MEMQLWTGYGNIITLCPICKKSVTKNGISVEGREVWKINPHYSNGQLCSGVGYLTHSTASV